MPYERYCYYCKLIKSDDAFAPSQRVYRAGRKAGKCRLCASNQNKRWRHDNPEKVIQYRIQRRNDPRMKEYDRLRSYPRRYGITREKYEALRAAQDFKCAICGLHEDRHKLSRWGVLCLDHDHKTGALRKLLCAPCNKGLGCFKDNKYLMEKALQYLIYHEKMQGIK